MSTSTKIGFAILGAGMIADYHRQAIEANADLGAKLVAIGHYNPARFNEISEKYGVPCLDQAELLAQPEVDPTRVAVVGDSYVWGFGVEQEEVLTSRMQTLCPHLEVINLGVSGYSTDQEFLLYKERGVLFEPDVVVLVIAPNDFEGNGRR